MKNRSHLPEILLHLLIVMVLPLAAITAVSKVVEIAGIKPDWCDAVVLLMKTAVMVNVAIHPLPSKYNTAPGEPIILFPANAPLGYKKPSEHDADEYDEESQSRKLSRKLRTKSQRRNMLITMQMSSRKPI